MSTILDVLFHWSPTDRRVDILKHGLQVYSEPAVQSQGRWPYISLSTRPSLAWGLSGDFVRSREEDPIEDWDLWEVRIPEGSEIHVRSFWWPKLEEIKVYTSIPPDRLWFVGQRNDTLVALSLESDEPLVYEP